MAKVDAKKVEAKEMSLDEQLRAKREELIVVRQGLGSTLQNPHTIGKIRREIARILTKVNAERKAK
jgi:ribosomal protein L29